MSEKLKLSTKKNPEKQVDIASVLNLQPNSVVHIQTDEAGDPELQEMFEGLTNFFKSHGVLTLITPRSVSINQVSEEEMNKKGWYKGESENSQEN